MKLYILALCFLATVLSGCEKLLDKEPTDQLSLEDVFKDVSGAKTALAGAYFSLLGSSHYQRNVMVYPDLLAGNIKFSKTTNLRLDDVYNASQTALESGMNETYTALYSELNNVNNVIKYTSSAAGSDADKSKIVAEALCIRALVHFDLLRIYARPINYTNDGSHPGIVINLQPQLFSDASPVRLTAAQSYQAIVTDLQRAIANFDNTNVGILSSGYKQNYFTKASAKALLAKVYLYQGNWDAAYAMADDVIKTEPYTLLTNATYVASWTGRAPSTESIFELPIETATSGTTLGSYYDIANSTYRMYAATTDITGLYSTTDVRNRASMFNSVALSGVTYYFTKKYAAGEANATPLKVLRLSELYLIRAEAAVEKTTPDFIQANADLNLIRKRADPYATTLNITVKADFIDAVLLERRKELAFEGNLLFDLLRKKKDVARVDGTALTPNLTTNDYRLIMPIPANTVNANKFMVQNTDY